MFDCLKLNNVNLDLSIAMREMLIPGEKEVAGVVGIFHISWQKRTWGHIKEYLT